VRNSGWRARRLLVLCWHGISLDDEHCWRPGLYVSPRRFRRRLEAIRNSGCSVLPLSEGLERLWRGCLPPKSVVLTFDDGFYDFHEVAAPILNEFGYPATVYLTTYYVDFQRPVFSSVLSYLAWKGCRAENRQDGTVAATGIRVAYNRVLEQASQHGLSAVEKDELAQNFALLACVDYDEIARRRLLHLMNAAEIAELARSGNFVFEMHTHRHRTPADPVLLLKELSENRARIRDLTGRVPVHFCYPDGDVTADMFPVLDRAGVRSATTCEAGLVEAATNPYLIPRLLDMPAVDDLTFQSWLDGTPSILGYGRSSAARIPVCLNVCPSASADGENEATTVTF
jgi:peptidoglycan/xylan/chitin deacetylase (PgdA/CDA1 family)